MDNPSPSGGAAFGTLIAANDAPSRETSPSPPTEALNVTRNLGNPHPRLAKKRGHFGDPRGAQDFPQNPGKSRAPYRRLGAPFRTLIAAKGALSPPGGGAPF